MAYNILIVDDSLIIRAMLIKTLKAAGVPIGKIEEAENGKVALEKMEKSWIDIVFVDINMPVMDGVTMIENMEERGIIKNLPTVVVSTEGSKTKIERLWNKGIAAFIGKPFTPEEIRKIVRDILGEWDDAAEAEPEGDMF